MSAPRSEVLDVVAAVFGQGGIMATRFPGYEPRPQQVEMARAVAAAIAAGSHLLVEAGTGVGKSRAYLVPAIHAAVTRGKRVLVATANIALQEQLVSKDLPALRAELPWAFDFVLVKGLSNYLCQDRLAHATTAELRAVDFDKGCDVDALLAWCAMTATGDVSEAGTVPGSVWSLLSVGSDACKGGSCSFAKTCFANRVRERAKAAHVIVANYHLMFADMMVRGASETGNGVLPKVDIVIADELHRCAEIARDFIGERVGEGAIKRLVGDAMRAAREAGVQLDDDVLLRVEYEAQQCFARVLKHKRSTEYNVRLRGPGEVDVAALVKALQDVANEVGGHANSDHYDGGSRQAFRKLRDRALKHVATLEACAQASDTNAVYFIEEQAAGKVQRGALCTKPVDVTEYLATGLFDAHETVIGTSATITIAGSFEHVRSEIGAHDVTTLSVGSPFDLKRAALLVVPAGLPEPNEAAYRTEVPRLTSATVALAEGRTLALFTTYRNLQATAELMRRDGTASRYRMLVQGEAPRIRLIDEFRRDTRSVLLGTASMWEGVDVQGESLSCVVIDRLPFLTPDDPVLDVIVERDPRGWFAKWSLPRAVIAFRQGFGRLIRSTRDRGVVVCLDRRIVDKSYGKTFVRSLGGVELSRNLDDVGAFLRTGDRSPMGG